MGRVRGKSVEILRFEMINNSLKMNFISTTCVKKVHCLRNHVLVFVGIAK